LVWSVRSARGSRHLPYTRLFRSKDERKGQQKEETFFYKGGLAEFVKHLLGNRKSLHPKPIVFETTIGLGCRDLRLPSKCFTNSRSEEHTSELQSRVDVVCRLLLE